MDIPNAAAEAARGGVMSAADRLNEINVESGAA